MHFCRQTVQVSISQPYGMDQVIDPGSCSLAVFRSKASLQGQRASRVLVVKVLLRWLRGVLNQPVFDFGEQLPLGVCA